LDLVVFGAAAAAPHPDNAALPVLSAAEFGPRRLVGIDTGGV
jgi:hypothetical protein